ncbi:Outer membrane protein TolC [Mesonia phycicola]|uniref:Outer membrane protein TolC n=1 Tax=Mesonia phycicola TaxID=579105 RepID=A0A1M6FMX6_9FLAO|nr:TolC family protein [Mesonia phycicola]SHI99108.1 Outer membrane protein TolC [Mesonia phycicola]
MKNKIQYKNILKISYFKYAFCLIVTLFCGFYGHAQLLENYIKQAIENSPQVKAVELNYKVAEEKINEANTLPNTEFSAGYFVSEPETKTGPQKAKVSIHQMMPWFGTITARENYSSSLADAAYVDIVITKRQLAMQVTQTYYQLYALKTKQKILQQNIDLLKTYEDLALNAVEVNKASAVDVLKLQIRQNEINEQKELLMGDEFATESKFNNLLNQEEQPIMVEDSITILEEEPFLTMNDLELHPELEKYDQLYLSIKQSTKLNSAESLPNIGFGLDYIAVQKLPNETFNDNGKDVFMPTVSVSIPIFNQQYKSANRQLKIQQEELKLKKENRKNELDSRLKDAIQQRISARISYNAQQKNITQAKNAEEILLKQYETSTLNFRDVLDIQELQLKFQLKQIEAIKNYYLQTAIINYLSN